MKTWIYRYKIDGKTEKLTIGHYPNMGLHDANVRFLELSNQRREGDNPKTLIQAQEADRERQKIIGGTEKPRERYLSLDEIKTLWRFLDSDQNQMALQTKCAIKIILLTGVRTAELRLATVDEFDFENSLWTIPAASKTDSVMKIHLSPQVKALLMELKQ